MNRASGQPMQKAAYLCYAVGITSASRLLPFRVSSAARDAAAPAPPSGVRLIDQPHLAAAVALDPQEPRRARRQRLVQGLGAGGQRFVAVATPVTPERRHGRS